MQNQLSKNEALTAFIIIQSFYPNKFRLVTNQVATLVNLQAQSVRNMVSDGAFPIFSYKDGGHRYFDIRDVAEYLDQARLASKPSITPPKKIGAPKENSKVGQQKKPREAAVVLKGGAV